MSTVESRAVKPPKPVFAVDVRTLAGHKLSERVEGSDLVAELTAKAVAQFQKRHQLGEGDYALTLPRLGHSSALDPTATLHQAGVRQGDVLVLISRAPHVDG